MEPEFPLGFELHWQMTQCEQFAFVGLLMGIRPKLCIEVGTYQGGSLQALAKYSERVCSVDIDPTVEQRLAHRFSNVSFYSGNSAEVLPALVDQLNTQGMHVDFVLIDGDHSQAGVKRDIESILKLKPQQRTTVILHDSFNPDCRAGMRDARWDDCPFVHRVELDFIPGIFHENAFDTAEARTMWGGFAYAVLEPIQRNGALTIGESQKGLFEAVHSVSAHIPYRRPPIHHRIANRIDRFLLNRKKLAN